jgi:hypothetical protein
MSIALVHETGTHAASGDAFDTLAVWITRFDADGKADRQWAVDMAHDQLEELWARNPVQ